MDNEKNYKTVAKIGRPKGQDFPKRLNVVLTNDMHADLHALSKLTGKKVSELAREAIANYLSQQD